MTNCIFALSLGLGGVVLAPGIADAQNAKCAERAMVVERLEHAYGETRQSIGLGQNNAIVETWASDSTGTWTIIVTLPDGISCLVASGESWEHLAERAAAPGNDA